MRLFTLLLLFLTSSPTHAIFEVAPLLELVAGQISEIERLTEAVGLAKEQTQLLRDLNRDIDRTVRQIQSVQSIISRTQGLDPRSVKSISDLNELLRRAKQTKRDIEELTLAKIEFADQAIGQTALQADTTYKMGQEMVAAGSDLSQESRQASPGRAAQISAAAGSAQMLAQGVELQTLSQLVQLQALSLDLQKTQLEREVQHERTRRVFVEQELGRARPRSR